MMTNSIAYPIGDSLYLNITNRCTNECSFCIRYKTDLFNQQYPLWLEHEPSAEEVIEAIGNPTKYKQIVFCGYGEPTIRLDVIKEVAKKLKSKLTTHPLSPSLNKRGGNPNEVREGASLIRVDTNGTANLFWGRNILPELKGLIDHISISLDAENAEVYNQICHPAFGEKSYPAVLEFIKAAKKYIPIVEATVVGLPGIDIAACRKIAADLGVGFRVRPYYEQTYVK